MARDRDPSLAFLPQQGFVRPGLSFGQSSIFTFRWCRFILLYYHFLWVVKKKKLVVEEGFDVTPGTITNIVVSMDQETLDDPSLKMGGSFTTGRTICKTWFLFTVGSS